MTIVKAQTGGGATRPTWDVVIPVKAAESGKSRLRIPDVEHASLARAIALDTVQAVSRCDVVAEIVVVTSDAVITTELSGWSGVRTVRDPGAGLDPAIARGLDEADRAKPRAVLLGDLPALQEEELREALTQASQWARAFVPDADGLGSVLATAGPGLGLRPRFGRRSADAHRAAGFADLSVPADSGLRRDLDVIDHVAALTRAGLGARTSALLEPVLSPAR